MRKNSLIHRLHIISGQVKGLAGLIEENADCQKVTEQFQAVNAGLKKAFALYLKENLAACLKTPNTKEKKRIEFLIREIIKNK